MISISVFAVFSCRMKKLAKSYRGHRKQKLYVVIFYIEMFKKKLFSVVFFNYEMSENIPQCN